MKKSVLALIVVSLTVTACPYVDEYEYVNEETYTPIYMSRENLELSVNYKEGERQMEQTGKIYFRSPYIFINERYKGVHVVNNSDPFNPVREGFIVAPGCIDMAVKGNILYLDNAVDLVSFDLDAKKEVSRNRNVFPEPLPPDDIFRYYNQSRPKGYIIIGWEKINETYRQRRYKD